METKTGVGFVIPIYAVMFMLCTEFLNHITFRFRTVQTTSVRHKKSFRRSKAVSLAVPHKLRSLLRNLDPV